MYIDNLRGIGRILESAEDCNVSSSVYSPFQYTIGAVVAVYLPFSTTVML